MCDNDALYCFLSVTLHLPDYIIGLIYALIVSIVIITPFLLIGKYWDMQAKKRRKLGIKTPRELYFEKLERESIVLLAQELSVPIPDPTHSAQAAAATAPVEKLTNDEMNNVCDLIDEEPVGNNDDDSDVEYLDFEDYAPLLTHDRAENPHTMINGPTGKGKTFFARALAHMYLENNGTILVINPNHKSGEWNDNVVTVDDDGEITLINKTFQWLLDEIKRRASVLKNEGENAIEWIQVIWDELPETVEENKLAMLFLRKILRRGRALKIGITALVQLDTAGETGLKGRAGLKRGFTHIYLGPTARIWKRARPYIDRDNKRPIAFERNGTLIIGDLTEENIATLANTPIDDNAYLKIDYSGVVLEEDTPDKTKWTAQHILAASILANEDISVYALAKRLFPDTNGKGRAHTRTQAIVQDIKNALVHERTTKGYPLVTFDDEEFEDEEDLNACGVSDMI